MKKTIIPFVSILLFISCNKTKEYDATGVFDSTTVTVSAETAGKILSFNISEGDSILEGDRIAVVDTTLLVLQQMQLRSQRQSAESVSPDIQAQAAALRKQIEHQQQECERQKRLLDDGATTRKQYDDATAQLSILNGQLSGLLSTLSKNRTSITDNASAIQYQSQQIGEQIRRSTVIAPLTGTVLEKYAEQGEYAIPGKPLCKISNLNDIYLRAYFTASQLANLKIGQKVTVIADFGGDRQYDYPGTITWISEESEFTPKSIQTNESRANLVYAVKIAVKNDGRLKLGQYGEVRL